MRRLRLPLALAGAALALSALLMRCSDGAPVARSAPEPAFPRAMDQSDWERARSRRTAALPAAAPPTPPTPDSPPIAPAPSRAPQDPFLVALPGVEGQPLLVLEANALRHSRLGELFVRCVVNRDGEDGLAEFRRESGVDPLTDVDRVAFSPEGVIVSGFFDRARFDRLEPTRVEQHGERGRLYRRDGGGAGAEGMIFGTWGDQLVALGSERFVQDALDRLDGRAPASQPAFPEELTYGEAYGVIPGTALEPLLRGTRGEIGERLAALAERVELHADAMNDVAVVARVSGSDGAGLDDLASTIGTALSLARLQAKAAGTGGLADVLEFARVERGTGTFSVELDVPAEVLERWFEGCEAAR